MDRKFSLQDVMQLQPSLMVEKEIYIIESSNTKLYLEWYLNTNYGCEYALYGNDFEEIDGGVVDDIEYENNICVMRLFVGLLKDMNERGKSISKMAETDIPTFEDCVELKWKDKVDAIKREMVFNV